MKNETIKENGFTNFVLNFVSLLAFQLWDSSYWMILVMNYYFSKGDNAKDCTTCIFRRFWDQNRAADAV
jgi:hypothetical protein